MDARAAVIRFLLSVPATGRVVDSSGGSGGAVEVAHGGGTGSSGSGERACDVNALGPLALTPLHFLAWGASGFLDRLHESLLDDILEVVFEPLFLPYFFSQ